MFAVESVRRRLLDDALLLRAETVVAAELGHKCSLPREQAASR